MNEKDFDFSLEPGRKLEILNYEKIAPTISVIIPFYNDLKYIEQSVNCILNQTYPCFELLIIDDGSKDKASLKKLEEVSKLDKRIKVFHKQNEGLSATRDYGASVASKETKYFMFIDSDDLIEKTYLECAYWALETNLDAAWCYSDSLGFDAFTYVWQKWFDSERMKKVNDLVSAALVRKTAYFEVNGYELREKAVNEDWNFWLKLIAKGKYPVHMSFLGQWYRRKDSGELLKANANRKRSLEIINQTASTIKKSVTAIQYPRYEFNYMMPIDIEKIGIFKKKKDDKINILMIFPWMITGGGDIFNLELIKRLDHKKFNFIILTTETNVNILRQQFEEYATVYDLTSFLDVTHWLSFIEYIIEKENINLIFNSNSLYGYSILPYIKAKYPSLPIMDYVHMEEWYYRNGGYARTSSIYQNVIDKTLVCNKSTEKVLTSHFHRNKAEVSTVYIGVDEKKFDPDKFNRQEILSKYNINSQDKFVISYICRISSQKRPMLFFEIIKSALQKRNDLLFVVVGDGDMLNLLRSKVESNHLKEHVVFLGNISNPSEIYKISDITLNCSIKEGLALTSYESLSMGVPVISADVGGQRELIDSTTGVIVPCYQKEIEISNYQYKQEEISNYVEAINKIIENLTTYKNACRKRILGSFTLDQMAVNMTKEIEKVVKKPNKEKIENGKSLSKQIEMCREIVFANIQGDKEKNRLLINDYMKKVYNISIYNIGNYEFYARLRERLWKYPLWRKFTKTKLWKILKGRD